MPFFHTQRNGKLQFTELPLEMQNAECRMQNKGIFFENDFMNKIYGPLPIP